MTQYIDKSAILKEIEKLRKKNHKSEYVYDSLDTEYTLKSIISFINTLEVKEVDFETAFAASVDHFDEKNNYGQWPESDLREFAEHFFELGLNYIKSNKNE